MAKTTLSNHTYEELKHLIVMGILSQRERISESNIATKLKVSRTPIREAIRRLEQDGLISRDSLGAYVTALTKKEAMDLYTMRIELEVLSVKLAMKNKSLEQLKKLKVIIEQIENLKLNKEEKVSEIINVNSEFHAHLDTMSQNFYLKRTLFDIRMRLSLLRASSLVAEERRPKSLQEHVEIGKAILSGEVDIAVSKVKAHTKEAAEFAISRSFL